jgi:hypothetical protein
VSYGGVSTLYLDIDPDSLRPPVFGAFAAADYVFLSSAVDAEHVGDDVAAFFAVGEDTVTRQVGDISIEGDVTASLTAATDKDVAPEVGASATISTSADIDIGPYNLAVADFIAASDYWFNAVNPELTGDITAVVSTDGIGGYGPLQDASNVYATFSAASEYVASTGVPQAALIEGSVAGFFFASSEIGSGFDSLPQFVLFTADGDYEYEFVPPVTTTPADTTYVCEGIPGRGAQAYGAYTETDQDGAWTENVGFAMSEGGERGAYTQDDAYLPGYKPNVFDTIEPPAYRYYGYGFLTYIGQYGFITEADEYGFYTDSVAADSVVPKTTYTIESKPKTTTTDEEKLIGG